MRSYVANVVVRHYFVITVEADSTQQADPLLASAAIDAVTPAGWIREYPENVNPDGVDVEVYDILRDYPKEN